MLEMRSIEPAAASGNTAAGLFELGNASPNTEAEGWFSAQVERGSREIFCKIVRVTPELAEIILRNNPANRHVSPRKLGEYARDLKSAKWKLNGETIIIANTGELNDGQHRLVACKEAGVSFETIMVFGPDRASRDTIDTGLKRTIGAILAMGGHANANQLAHAVALLINYERHKTLAFRPDWRATSSDVEAWLDGHPDIAARFRGDAMSAAAKFKASRGLFAALHHLTASASPEYDKLFWSRVLNGDELDRSDPVARLRDRLIQISQSKAKFPIVEVAALVIKAWNLSRQHRLLRQGLRWRSEGDGAEAFPQVE